MVDSGHTPKLDEQLCFPFYLIAKEIAGMYRPFLEEMDITYPQYLVMMVLWENQPLTVNQIGAKLTLDSGTLTPLLKRLEVKGYLERKRNKNDERVVEIFLTEKGNKLQQQACVVPEQLTSQLNLSIEEIKTLKTILDKLITKIKK